MFKIGIDVGGTFTDFVVVKDHEPPRYFKAPSTSDEPSQGVMAGLSDAASGYGLPLEDFLSSTEMVIHGTTVATNTHGTPPAPTVVTTASAPTTMITVIGSMHSQDQNAYVPIRTRVSPKA